MNPRTTVAIAFGASMGDRFRTLLLALHALDAQPELDIRRVSRVYATAPVGGVARTGFLNAVALADTTLSPRALLVLCKTLELRLGRRPTRSWADRIIDLDVLVYGDRVVVEEGLRVPHPRLVERDFFLGALAEVWPEAKNPWTGLSWLASRRTYPIVGVLPRGDRIGAGPSRELA